MGQGIPRDQPIFPCFNQKQKTPERQFEVHQWKW